MEEILSSLGVAEEAPIIEVWNKIDLLDPDARAACLAQVDRQDNLQAISAVTGQGVDGLVQAIAKAAIPERTSERLRLGFDQGKSRAWLFDAGVVEAETVTENAYVIDVLWSAKDKAQFKKL